MLTKCETPFIRRIIPGGINGVSHFVNINVTP